MTSVTRPLGILMLRGKMADEPGCMACEATFPYPVRRKVVEGSSTPMCADDAWAMLPLYIDAARELEAEGVAAITANCGLIALMQNELAAAVNVPVVTSALTTVPTVHRAMPKRRIGILTFFTQAVGEANFKASGWSGDDIPIALAGVGESQAWNTFLQTKEISPALRIALEADLLEVIEDLEKRYPDIGAFVAECTMLPACLDAVRRKVEKPIYDILNVLDFAMSGYERAPDARAWSLIQKETAA